MHRAVWVAAGAAFCSAAVAVGWWVAGEAAVPGVWLAPRADHADASPPANSMAPETTVDSVRSAHVLQAPPAAIGRFRVNAAGELMIDSQLRSDLETALALSTFAQASAVLETELQSLPPQAAAAARDLLERFETYQAAQRQSFPPDDAPLVPEEGLAQLDAIKALRTTYFGAAKAQALFGADEAVARRLLELMRDDPLPNAPMADKAMRAQARFDMERGAAAR